MAVTGHSSNEVVTKSFKTIYGIAPFKVLAINPSMDQLIAIGINAQKEPEYVGEKSRIEIWMQTQLPAEPTDGVSDKSLSELGVPNQLIQKMSIFTSNTLKGKADGSTSVWINNFGNICGTTAGEQPTASWWKANGQHVAREGEIELIKFIRAWVNAGTTDEVYIDDWAAIVNGNMNELRIIHKDFKENIVRSMIEVKVTKEGKAYAGIYNGHHEPWNIIGLTNWAKEFKVLKTGQHVSYVLKEFVHSEPVPTTDEAVTDSGANSQWT